MLTTVSRLQKAFPPEAGVFCTPTETLIVPDAKRAFITLGIRSSQPLAFHVGDIPKDLTEDIRLAPNRKPVYWLAGTSTAEMFQDAKDILALAGNLSWKKKGFPFKFTFASKAGYLQDPEQHDLSFGPLMNASAPIGYFHDHGVAAIQWGNADIAISLG